MLAGDIDYYTEQQQALTEACSTDLLRGNVLSWSFVWPRPPLLQLAASLRDTELFGSAIPLQVSFKSLEGVGYCTIY